MSKFITTILFAVLIGTLIRCHLHDIDEKHEQVKNEVPTTCVIHAEGKIIYRGCN